MFFVDTIETEGSAIAATSREARSTPSPSTRPATQAPSRTATASTNVSPAARAGRRAGPALRRARRAGRSSSTYGRRTSGGPAARPTRCTCRSPRSSPPTGVPEAVRGREAVVICRSGQRSRTGARALVERGARAVDVEGGMHAWARAGHPVADEHGNRGTIA
ncbi:rhodanese-like domain-containing protein [Streptomyces fradiae]|uniref:rhodanese-like domain-containing protein n=1 Tax=Streptomyces fradiae TaxID=1906 RepID=UPI0035BE7050